MAAFSAFLCQASTDSAQGGEIQRDEVDHGGGAAKSRRLVTGVMVVGGDRAEHGQVEVGVRVHAAGQDEFAARIDLPCISHLQI